ncbi:phage scaffolding protein [Geosporobacter ferrireducens]|uniref:phage scaffolding protein n=1 Tax=Geosporobacter ferrireducens TaxID=1424294 RepID=UPI00139F059C|nr:phage scaffolding protein [Geosporobacter ferrireducens]MTI56148.1 hypothetical protein [Geosporobacter ferrireducens]
MKKMPFFIDLQLFAEKTLKDILGEDLYNQVIQKAGDSKIDIVSNGNWIPKDKFNQLNEENKDLKSQLTERDKQLKDLEGKAKGNEELETQLKDLQEQNKQTTKEFEAKIKDLSISNAIKMALSGQVHDVDLVAELLDKAKIELDDKGNVKAGLEDQLKTLKESKSFLFVEKEAKPTFKGVKPVEGKDPSGNPISVGASFAQAANESGKAPAATPNPWG